MPQINFVLIFVFGLAMVSLDGLLALLGLLFTVTIASLILVNLL